MAYKVTLNTLTKIYVMWLTWHKWVTYGPLHFIEVSYECSEVHYFFFHNSHIDRFWQNTLTRWGRKMYLNVLVYFKDFQKRSKAKGLWRFIVNSPPLPWITIFNIDLPCDCFFLGGGVRKGFYKSTYIID